MPTVQHSSLTGANNHEPKGIEGASNEDLLVADGAGSGTWKKPEATSIASTSHRAGEVLTADGGDGSDYGILVWKDLQGIVKASGSGVGWPLFTNYIGTSVDAYAFGATEAVHFVFHIPHDYAVGTDIYIHAHWSHNGTTITGTMTWTYECTYAKGHNQTVFAAPVTGTISYATVDIATTPQYVHRIDEVQLSAAVPSASQLDTALLEPDGLILMHFEATAIPTITGGAPNEPFLLEVDVHYQSDITGTLNKAPNFYA